MTHPELNLRVDEMKRDWIDRNYDTVLLFIKNRFASANGHSFSTDDLHDYFVEPDNANYWGGLIARLKKEKRIEDSGQRRKSTRKSANGRKVTLWKAV